MARLAKKSARPKSAKSGGNTKRRSSLEVALRDHIAALNENTDAIMAHTMVVAGDDLQSENGVCVVSFAEKKDEEHPCNSFDDCRKLGRKLGGVGHFYARGSK